MSIVKSINHQIGIGLTGANALWYLLALLIDEAGWVKTKDSDGTTFSSSGTQVTSGNSGANGLGNALAWVEVRNPDSSLYLSFQKSDLNNTEYRIKFYTVASTGGSATQVPASTDEVVVTGGGTDASPTFSVPVIGASDETDYWVHAVADTEAPYTFCFFGKAGGGDAIHTFIFLDAALDGTLEDGDPFKYIFSAKVVGGGFDTASSYALGSDDILGVWTWLDKGGPNETIRPVHAWFYATYQSDSISPFSLPESPISAKQVLLPVIWGREEFFNSGDGGQTKGYKCVSSLFSWNPRSNSSTIITGDLLSLSGGKHAICLSELIMHLWDGSSLTNLSHSENAFNAISPIFSIQGGGGSSDSTAPVVSNVTPTPGTVIRPNTPLGFDITDETGIRRALFKVVLGNDWEIPFDGENFSPRYAAESTRTTITGGFHFELVRTGNWPTPPTVEPLVFDTAGNINS